MTSDERGRLFICDHFHVTSADVRLNSADVIFDGDFPHSGLEIHRDVAGFERFPCACYCFCPAFIFVGTIDV